MCIRLAAPPSSAIDAPRLARSAILLHAAKAIPQINGEQTRARMGPRRRHRTRCVSGVRRRIEPHCLRPPPSWPDAWSSDRGLVSISRAARPAPESCCFDPTLLASLSDGLCPCIDGVAWLQAATLGNLVGAAATTSCVKISSRVPAEQVRRARIGRQRSRHWRDRAAFPVDQTVEIPSAVQMPYVRTA